MINRIIKYSLDNRLIVLALSLLLVIAGSYTASRMEVDVFPDLTAPTVVVMTEAQGLAAEEVERLVTFPVETALNGATDVRRVRSQSSTGFSVVWVEFDWGTDIYIARQIVSEKLVGVASSLPAGAGTPTLAPQSSLLGEVMIIGMTSDSMEIGDLRTLADWTMRPRLLSVEGVAQVTVSGGEILEYQILLDPLRMKYYGVTVDEAIAAAENINANAAGGIINDHGNEYIIRGTARTTDPREMGRSVVKQADGLPVTFADIAEVRTGVKSPILGQASVEGRPAVLLSVTKQPGVDTHRLVERLDETLADLEKNIPHGVEFNTDIFRQSTFIDASIRNIERALIEGAVLVVVILFIFLANVRTTVISLIAIPLSLLFSILALKAMGLTLNTMSLGGMAIAIGSLVDDAIIDVENVFRRLRENHLLPEDRREPALTVIYRASTEIRSSIFNATLIIIVTFLPLFFLSGMEGRMLTSLGVSFIVSLFASMVVAKTLTPVLCSYMLTSPRMLDSHEREPRITRKMKEGYGKMLSWALGHRKIVVGVAAVLLVGALAVMTTLGRSFLPPFNEGSMSIALASLPGTNIEHSGRIASVAEEMLMTIPEVKTVARKTGRAELDEHALGSNTSELDVPFELKDRSREELFAEVREKLGSIDGAVFEIGQPISHRMDMLLSGTRSNIAIKIFGTDLNEMFAIGGRIKSLVGDIPGLVDVNVEQQIESPQIHIKPRREVLARVGIPVGEFIEDLEVALSGRVVSQVYDKERNMDVTLKFDDRSRESIEALGDMLFDATVDGRSVKVPLGYIAEIVSTSGPNSVNRENVIRKVVVSANVDGGDLRGIVGEISRRIDESIVLPENYHIEYGGQFESEAAASRTLMLTSLLSLLVVFLLLFGEFRDLRITGVILLNLPLALIGGIFAVWVSSGVISIPSIIGFISLFGIATRNGILLISHYRDLAAGGMELYERVAVGSRDRLNPIILTALTSGLAMIPIALNGSLPGNEIQSPMAIVILGGLLTSTLLNLFVVPVFYTFICKKQKA
ncbi:MAG: efflux RND transporter permease subunit [Rikenellaceae bacterium]|nr:efflux RND transporter permease subunit [Rikenellaceae bacterium]